MKYFHVHLSVTDIADSVHFYNTLFGQEPTKRRDNYAKWVLQEPALNFAISQASEQGSLGLHHLGFEFDSDEALEAIGTQISSIPSERQRQQSSTTCCYAKSNKYWVDDPQNITWENFHTLSEVDEYQDSGITKEDGSEEPSENCVANGCCQPEQHSETPSKSSCC